jgi:spermidine/putrescine transport system permease protein
MSGSRRSWGPEAGSLLLVPGLAWVLGLFLLPLLALLPLSLAEPLGRFSLRFSVTGRIANYSEVLQQYGPLLLRSLRVAGLATALALVISYPLACFIAFRGGRWRPLLTGLVVLPFFTASLVRMIGWTTLLADQGPLLGLLRSLDLVIPLEALGLLHDGRLLNTTPAVVGGLAYNAVPFLVLPLVVSLERIGAPLLEAAADLHAGPWSTLRRVIWPLSQPGLAAGLTLSLVPTVGDVIHPQMLGGPNDHLIGNALQNLVLVQRQLPRSAALTVLLMALLGVTVLIGLRGGNRRELPLP